MKQTHPDLADREILSHLGGFNIATHAHRPLSTLSGGQLVRVSVAVAVYGGKHLLILDEPTNHLDIESISAMREALLGFEGAAVVISHDQAFVEAFAERTFRVEGCKCVELEGGVKEYVEQLQKTVIK
jgi:ATP-binding cassette, subfamily F, member 3